MIELIPRIIFHPGYLVLCLLVGFAGRKRRLGFIGSTMVAFVLTPLLGSITLFLTAPAKDDELKARYAQKMRAAQAKAQPDPQPANQQSARFWRRRRKPEPAPAPPPSSSRWRSRRKRRKRSITNADT